MMPATLEATHRLVFADECALGRGQDAENVERPPAQLYRLVAAAQFAPSAVEPEPAEADLPLGHRIVPIQEN
jgi:hypothetical protein